MASMTERKIQCNFCKENHHIKDCVTLQEHQCTYCKEKGHTNPRCPKAPQNQPEVREERLRKKHGDNYCPIITVNGKTRRATSKQNVIDTTEEPPPGFTIVSRQAKKDPNSWASKVGKGNERENARQTLAQAIGAPIPVHTDEGIQRTKQWLDKYPVHMERQFGPFWMFHVFGTRLEMEMAKKLRTSERIEEFEEHLKVKYGDSWLFESQNTIDDCAFLRNLRKERELDDFDRWLNAGLKLKILSNTFDA